MSDTKIKVLIVDDSAIARGIFEKAFKATSSFEVIGSVSNGRKAVDFCRSNKVQLVVTDYDMPELNGVEATRIIPKIILPKQMPWKQAPSFMKLNQAFLPLAHKAWFCLFKKFWTLLKRQMPVPAITIVRKARPRIPALRLPPTLPTALRFCALELLQEARPLFRKYSKALEKIFPCLFFMFSI